MPASCELKGFTITTLSCNVCSLLQLHVQFISKPEQYCEKVCFFLNPTAGYCACKNKISVYWESRAIKRSPWWRSENSFIRFVYCQKCHLLDFCRARVTLCASKIVKSKDPVDSCELMSYLFLSCAFPAHLTSLSPALKHKYDMCREQ